MLAVDTNVVVRLLVDDDARQSAVARTAFRQPVWIAKTVLLETAWVLRSVFGYSSLQVRHALKSLLGLKNVQVEDETCLAAAFDLAANGLDFADALHLCSRPAESTFLTFDRDLVRAATRAGQTKISETVVVRH